MREQRRASMATRGIAMGTIAAGMFGVGLVLPSLAQASLLAAAGVCSGVSSYGQYIGSYCVNGDDPGQSAPGSVPGGSGTGSGVVFGGSSAGALQDYGVFHGYAKAADQGVAGLGDAGGTTASSRGVMSDTWNIAGGSGFGYLTLTWSVSGSTALDGYRGAYADLQMEVQTATTGNQYGSGQLVITEGGVYSIGHLPFFFGQPLDLAVSSGVYAASGYDAGGGAYAYYAAADFAHTSILTGIAAYDTSGRLIDGITISAASGARYPVMVDAPPIDPPPVDPPPVDPPSQSVPEPASGALLVAGVAVAGWQRRRRVLVADPANV